MKDNFSSGSDHYAKFRPTYPESLLESILSNVQSRSRAWDCGTGNGQMAALLTTHFDTIDATDISANQLAHGIQHPKITYSTQPAEHTNFPNRSFDLIIVAQAIHWFDFEKFYQEVKRTLHPEGLFVITGYGLIRVTKTIDKVIDHFYQHIIGPYWDPERQHIDEGYRTIPFPFRELPTPALQSTHHWSMEQFLGYISTWSAVKHYISNHHHSPIPQLQNQLKQIWGTSQVVTFPVLFRMGKL